MSISSEGLRFRWAAIKRALPWILTLLGFTGGGVTGYFAGWKLQLAELAAMKQDDRDAKKRLGALEAASTRHEERLDGHDGALKAESQSNRAERATRDVRHQTLVAEVEELKKPFRIEGLPKK